MSAAASFEMEAQFLTPAHVHGSQTVAPSEKVKILRQKLGFPSLNSFAGVGIELNRLRGAIPSPSH